MEGIKQFITRKLRLKVNEAKSKVANSKECTFLGYTIGSKGKIWISKKIKERIKTRIKTLTKRNRGRTLEAIIGELNQTLRG
jgi:RNA-directed DNA polymerase